MRASELLPAAFFIFQGCVSSETVVTLDTSHASKEKDELKFEESKSTIDFNRTNYDDKPAPLDGGTCQVDDPSVETQDCMSPQLVDGDSGDGECGVYLAFSTLPGTGIGMFAGRSFEEGDELMDVGDHLIPIVSLPQNHGDDVVSFEEPELVKSR